MMDCKYWLNYCHLLVNKDTSLIASTTLSIPKQEIGFVSLRNRGVQNNVHFNSGFSSLHWIISISNCSLSKSPEEAQVICLHSSVKLSTSTPIFHSKFVIKGFFKLLYNRASSNPSFPNIYKIDFTFYFLPQVLFSQMTNRLVV